MQRADGIRGEENFGGVFAFDNSAVHLTVFHFDGDRFIAADKAGGGEDDGFKQIATIANAADAGEVRSKLSAAVAELTGASTQPPGPRTWRNTEIRTPSERNCRPST